MQIHCVENGPTTAYMYGEYYHAFVLSENEVVIYQLEKKRVVFRESFPENRFTSIVAIEEMVYIGLTNGRVLQFGFEDDTEQYTYREIDPISTWCERPAKIGGRRKILLGGSCKILYTTATYEKRDHVFIACSGAIRRGVLPYRIKSHAYNADADRLLLVCETQDHFVLHTIEPVYKHGAMVYDELRTECTDIWVDSYLEPVAVSKHGHVAFLSSGEYLIWNPRGSVNAPLFRFPLSPEYRPRDQHCFVGREEEYFVSCGASTSTIEVLKLNEGIWRPWKSLEATDFTFEDPGTDGQRLIVRAVPSEDDVDKLPEMLWVFGNDASSGLQLEE